MERTERQKWSPCRSAAGCHLSHHAAISPLHCMNMQVHTCLCLLVCTEDDIDFDQSLRLFVNVDGERERERARNLTTFWLLAQITTIKNRLWDDEPAWHTYSWRSHCKDVSQPPKFPHLVMSGEWLRRMITDR